jgi:hypothetical protein
MKIMYNQLKLTTSIKKINLCFTFFWKVVLIHLEDLNMFKTGQHTQIKL